MHRIIASLLILITFTYGVMHNSVVNATTNPAIQSATSHQLGRSGWFTMVHLANSSLGPQQGPDGNLIQEGGFEAQGQAWSGCGNLALVDAQEDGAMFVRSGRYAIAMAINADGSGCPQLPDNTTPRQILAQAVQIPATAPAVTVSFWFRAAAGTSVELFLAQSFYQFDPNLNGVFLGRVATDQPPGWQLYRTVLRGDQLVQLRGRTVTFAIVIQANAPYDPQHALLLIDDVQVLARDGRTVAAPRPPDLQADGSRPLAVIKRDAQNNRWLYRMDLDGSNLQVIYQGLLGNVRYPAWSPDGQRLAVADYNTWPWPTPDPDPQNNLNAAALTVLNADGSNPRQLHQTQSRKGSRCPFIPRPGEQTETPSTLVRINEVQWLPTGNALAFEQSSVNVFCNGRFGGGLVDILRVSQTPGPELPTLARNATKPSINRRTGRMLFESFDPTPNGRTPGIWEVDLTLPSPREDRLIPHPADGQPVWSPDGQRFAIIRSTSSPSGDISERTQAMMIYTRADLDHPQQVLFADHGRTISKPSWSPRGNYLIYTLERSDGTTDLWWLNPTSGATGPITNDGRTLEAAWRPERPRLFLPLVRR